MAKKNAYNIDTMAKIIVCLVENFGKDGLVKYLLDRLIRIESDSIIPSHKSKEVIELEKKYGISLSELSRNKIYTKNKEMSKFIVIEHGLPEGQAIEMIFNEPKKEIVKNILEDIKMNLVYITKKEHKTIKNHRRTKGKNGYYWEESYDKAKIIVEKNS